MSDISIVEKPEWVSMDDIHNLLYYAHENNRKMGFHVKTAEMSGEDLKKHIGDRGRCFVALCGTKLIGVTAVRIVERNNRFINGKVAEQILVGVHPEYSGMHISTSLHDKVVEFSKNNNISYIEIQTAANNYRMQTVCLSWGFSYIDFKAYPNIDHYTVVMLKWLNTCPYNKKQIQKYYKIRRLKVRLRYKEGKIKRFGI